jgi:hypothetical protein
LRALETLLVFLELGNKFFSRVEEICPSKIKFFMSKCIRV